MSGLRFGAVQLAVPVVLAPMAGITDIPFRRLVHGHGALLTAEMVTARGLAEGDRRTWAMVDLPRDLGTRSLQLYGSDPAQLGAAVAELVDRDLVDHVDLNLGCPVPKVTRNGGGAALPVKRRLLRAVLRAAVTGAAGRVPVTAKMRVGLDAERHTHLDTGAIAAEEGIAAVALHGRTVEQGYAGEADWDRIAELRDLLPPDLPVLGNGDIWSAGDALAMVDRTGCDGVVVGRGCLGRPWLFADLAAAFRGDDPAGPPRFSATAATVRRHLDLLLDHADARGDDALTDAVVRRFRKHLRWYLQGYGRVPGALHDRAGRVGSVPDVEAVLACVPRDARVGRAAVREPRGKTSPGRVKLPHAWWDDRDADVEVESPTGILSGG